MPLKMVAIGEFEPRELADLPGAVVVLAGDDDALREAGRLMLSDVLVIAADEAARLAAIERHARTVMTLLDDGGPENWGAHLIDNDDNCGQRLREALGGFD